MTSKDDCEIVTIVLLDCDNEGKMLSTKFIV